jgi:hypothetical protein
MLVVFAFLGGILWLVLWQYKKEQARKAAMMAYIASQGYGYLPQADDRVAYFASPPFGLGFGRSASHIAYGQIAGVTFETFAYLYKTQHTDSKGHTHTQTHSYQVTWVPLPQAMGTMRLTADNAFLRLGKGLGARDLDTESEDFNKRWKVWCEDERLGHAVLAPHMIELLLRPDLQGRAYVFEGRALMTYRAGHTDLTETPWLVSVLAQIVDLIPPFLLDDGADRMPPQSP